MRGWLVWGIGVFAYAVAVLQRTSLGVVGLDAAARFGVSPGVLSTFVVVQLLVYAGMQIPAGVLIDRFGSRLALVGGMVLMASGQALMALTEQIEAGIGARVIVGAGDAFIFASVLRLLPSWFRPSLVPVLSQFTGLLGASGQIVSATGFMALLFWAGWTPAFLAASGLALGAAVLALALVRDQPPGESAEPVPRPLRELPTQLRQIWTDPGTRLGLWTHLATGFAWMVFAMMWGIPYLVQGEGVSAQAASGYYTLLVGTSVIFGPIVGILTARHPLRRSNLVLFVIAANALPWVAVILWPGPAPAWLLIVLMIGLAAGGPGSSIGMDFARTSVPRHQLGTATGIVLIGAFVGSVICIAGIGLFLDLISPNRTYGLAQFRLAFALQIPLWIIGTIGIFTSRRRLRRKMAEAGIVVPPWKDALQREWLRRRYRGR